MNWKDKLPWNCKRVTHVLVEVVNKPFKEALYDLYFIPNPRTGLGRELLTTFMDKKRAMQVMEEIRSGERNSRGVKETVIDRIVQ